MMRVFLVGILLVICLASSESKNLFCWLCAGGSGGSFNECNTRKVAQNCSKPEYQIAGEKPLDRCAYFSYYSLKKGKRIYAKCCTGASFCADDGEKFCENVSGGATQCQVECCSDEKCNDGGQFTVVKNWTSPTSFPTSSTTGIHSLDNKKHTKPANTGTFMVSGDLLFAACALAWMLVS